LIYKRRQIADGNRIFLLPTVVCFLFSFRSIFPLNPMHALPEKFALRRMLQNYLFRLDETIVELMRTDMRPGDDVAAPSVRFCEDSVIIWQDRPHSFTPTTYALLKQFLEAPKMMLSKEDIRQDVLCDDDAREGSLRQCISAARKELCRHQFPYRIETITRKGYRLVAET
jgi:DNA-binding response OmpR family regulator